MALDVVEVFSSLQGEGIQTGIPMDFVRLWGCNLRPLCSWCDTKYAMNLRTKKSLAIEEIIEQCNLRWTCISGGEPLLQDIYPLVSLLKYGTSTWPKPHKITIETNGTIKPTEELNHLVDLWTASPKIGHYDIDVLKSMSPLQLKFVLLEGMEVPIELIDEVKPDHVVFQPCAVMPFNIDENRKKMRWLADVLLELVDKLPGDTRVMLQMHKYLWGSERGR